MVGIVSHRSIKYVKNVDKMTKSMPLPTKKDQPLVMLALILYIDNPLNFSNGIHPF